jgi:hypothetical protein
MFTVQLHPVNRRETRMKTEKDPALTVFKDQVLTPPLWSCMGENKLHSRINKADYLGGSIIQRKNHHNFKYSFKSKYLCKSYLKLGNNSSYFITN